MFSTHHGNQNIFCDLIIFQIKKRKKLSSRILDRLVPLFGIKGIEYSKSGTLDSAEKSARLRFPQISKRTIVGSEYSLPSREIKEGKTRRNNSKFCQPSWRSFARGVANIKIFPSLHPPDNPTQADQTG